jgi:hypothetical protein
MRFNYHGYSGLTSISSDPGYHPLRSLGSNNAALAKNRKTATEPIHFQNVAGKNFFSLDGMIGQESERPDRDWRSNLHPLEKQGSEISRHPHASVGRGISWKVTGVHSNGRAEFHEVRHRCGSIRATLGYIAAGSRI